MPRTSSSVCPRPRKRQTIFHALRLCAISKKHLQSVWVVNFAALKEDGAEGTWCESVVVAVLLGVVTTTT